MFTKILVPVDVSDPGHSHRVLEAARAISKRDKASVRVLTVLEPPPAGFALYMPRDLSKKAMDEAKARVAELATKISGQKEGDFNIRYGRVYHEVIEEAEDWGADLIIMRSHRPAVSTYLLGSNAARIVRHANCSVLVLRDND
jgi:nucleotide-binding universal stress UspA family protein